MTLLLVGAKGTLWGLPEHPSLLQVSRLQKNVDDLQHALLKSLHDRQPTVIYAGNNKGSG